MMQTLRHRDNLPKFSPTQNPEKKELNFDALLKEVANMQKNISIATDHGITLSHILEHDLMTTRMLFNEDYIKATEEFNGSRVGEAVRCH